MLFDSMIALKFALMLALLLVGVAGIFLIAGLISLGPEVTIEFELNFWEGIAFVLCILLPLTLVILQGTFF